jgi:DNA-directed RNA polymerase specialized sigma subunit
MPYTYRVVARRAPSGWTLHVADLGTATTRSLATAEKDARAHILAVTGQDDAIVHVQPKLQLHLGQLADEARQASAELAEATVRVSAKSREAANELRSAGLSNVDIAAVLGVSEQRVSQLFGKVGSGKKD